MAELTPFRVYPSQIIHLGKRDPDRAEALAALGLEGDLPNWFFESVCGRKLIGYELNREPHMAEPQCRQCARVMAHARRVYQEMERRFTDATPPAAQS